jgi:membrane associated rhomboid family serine protease
MASINLPVSSQDTVSRPDPDDPFVIVAQGGREYTMTNSLVLSARGISHQVDPDRGLIRVHEADSARALAELQAFARENSNWPPPPNYAKPIPRTDNPPTVLMIGSLVLLYIVSGPWSEHSPWFRTGAINSDLILQDGQWWRLITALTLHADQGHLVGNCVIGGFMVHLLSRTTGYGVGWLSLILSAALANRLNIALRNAPHYSVGFSTAVFATIGILCGLQMAAGTKKSLLRGLLLPLGAGAGLLAMLGTGGKQTDLGAHLFGLGTGVACGLLLAICKLDRRGDRGRLQFILFVLTLCLIIGSWLLAMR